MKFEQTKLCKSVKVKVKIFILGVPHTKLFLKTWHQCCKKKNNNNKKTTTNQSLLISKWRECLFSFNCGWGGEATRQEKKEEGKKNRASNVFSQPTKECKAPSFLIKTEGLGWMSVEFHSRQLKSHDTVRISSILQYRLKLSVPLLLSAHCQP